MYTPLIVDDIIEEIPGFKSFILKTADNTSILYKAGQYLTFVLNHQGKESRRSYSLTSVPELGEPLTIGVKRIENGLMSRYLIDQVKKGDTLFTTGSGGLFTLPEKTDTYQQIFFLAAGSGITPVFALIKSTLHLHPHISVVLIYSSRTEEEAIFKTSLLQLEKEFTPRFRIEFIFSNAKDLSKAHLYRESLVRFLHTYTVASFTQTLFYICGPEEYMRMCTYGLQEAHVPRNHIKKENFNTTKPPAIKQLPPDKETRTVTILQQEKTIELPVSFPDSILQAARKSGVNLPYSCEVGRCGNCVATCLEGNVWMSYNEVLTDDEVTKGLILTCVGHPNGSNVKIKLR